MRNCAWAIIVLTSCRYHTKSPKFDRTRPNEHVKGTLRAKQRWASQVEFEACSTLANHTLAIRLTTGSKSLIAHAVLHRQRVVELQAQHKLALYLQVIVTHCLCNTASRRTMYQQFVQCGMAWSCRLNSMKLALQP